MVLQAFAAWSLQTALNRDLIPPMLHTRREPRQRLFSELNRRDPWFADVHGNQTQPQDLVHPNVVHRCQGRSSGACPSRNSGHTLEKDAIRRGMNRHTVAVRNQPTLALCIPNGSLGVRLVRETVARAGATPPAAKGAT